MLSSINNIFSKNKEPKFPLLFKRYCEDIKIVLQEDPALYNEEWFLDEFNERFSKIEIFFQEYLNKNKEEKTVHLLIKFLRNIKKLLWIKVFYNLTPNITYEDYIQKELGEQLLNNIFNNNLYIYKDCLIKKDFIRGGSCHHRSLLLKKFCDKIEIPNLKTSIIQKPQWHSFFKIEYWNEFYFSDITQWYNIMNYNQVNKYWDINHFSALDIENSDLFEFEDIRNFLHHLKRKSYDEIHIEVNRLKLIIDQNRLYFQVNDKSVKYNNAFYGKLPNTVDSQEEIFSLLLPNRKYLIPHIANKINPEILKSIVCESK